MVRAGEHVQAHLEHLAPGFSERMLAPAVVVSEVGAAESRERRWWWHTDVARWYLSAASGGLLVAALQPMRDGDPTAVVPVFTFRFILAYAVVMLVFSGLTLRAFSRHPARSAYRNLSARPAGPTAGDVLPALIAVGLALGVALWYVPWGQDLDTLLQRLVTGTCAVLLMIAAWATMTTSFAALYARWEHYHGGLGVPGERSRGFTDHLYLAVAVSTTLGTTDVRVEARGARRVVLLHSVLAFAFNGVALALLITSLAG